MKIGIMSDCHLGQYKFRKMQGLFNKFELLNYNAFKEAIDKFQSLNLDEIIIAGDMFDSPNPLMRSIKVAKEELAKITDADIHIISGNHEYSMKNEMFDSNVIDNFIQQDNVFTYASVENKYLSDEIAVSFVPYKFLTPETFNNLRQFISDSQQCKHILVMHGYVDFTKEHMNEDYALPVEVASLFDVVICGHIHLQNIKKTKSLTVITPGSLMPSNQANGENGVPSIYIYDTDNGEIEIINLKTSPKVLNLNVYNNINIKLEELTDIKYHDTIVNIKYFGSEEIDEKLYYNVLDNVLNLSLNSMKENTDIVEAAPVDKFWSYIKTHYNDYYQEFQELLRGD